MSNTVGKHMPIIKIKRQYLFLFSLSVLSGILFFLSLPNFLVLYGIPLIGFVCMIPLFLALFFSPSIRMSFYIVAVWTIVYVTLVFFWLLNFQEMALLSYLGVMIVFVLFYAHVITGIKCIMNTFSVAYRPLCIALFWVAYEYMRSRGFHAFPWALLSQTSHHISSFAQIASIAGDWIISFIVAYCNMVLCELLIYFLQKNTTVLAFTLRNSLLPIQQSPLCYQTHNSKLPYSLLFHICFLALLFVLSIAYGMISLAQKKHVKTDKSISILALQQNKDSWNTKDQVAVLENIITSSQEALESLETPPDVLIWSETSLSYTYQPDELPKTQLFYKQNPKDYPFLSFLRANNIPLITGIPRKQEKEDKTLYFNSAIILSSSGEILDSYAKNQLVPFAEYVPASNIPIIRALLNRLNIGSLWSPGRSVHTVHLPIPHSTTKDNTSTIENNQTISLGIIICFEDAFSFITRTQANLGAELLVNLSNVSWSKTKSAQVQQLIASKYRSIETGLPMVRVTNTGVTAIISPWGEVEQALPMFVQDTLSAQIPLYSISTMYRSIGDLFALICLISFIVIFVYCATHSYNRNKYR